MNWWIIVVWLLFGQCLHTLRRLTYLMLWREACGDSKTQYVAEPNSSLMTKYFATYLKHRDWWDHRRIFLYPGASLGIDFIYWAGMLVAWPIALTLGFTGTFQGIVWLFDKKKDTMVSDLGAFWRRITKWIRYRQMTPADRKVQCRVWKLEAEVNRLELCKQLLERETKLTIRRDTLRDDVLKESFRPYLEMDEDPDCLKQKQSARPVESKATLSQ